MDRSELEAISRRPLRYWNEDGIPDLLGGVIFVVIAAMNWGTYVGNPFVVAALIPVPIVTSFFGQKAVRKLKERLVFPRTGAMVPRQPVLRHRWVWTAVVFLAIAALVILMARFADAFFRWIPLVAGTAYTIGLVEGWRRMRLRRYLLLALVTATTTLTLASIGPRDQLGFILLMAVTGVALLTSGTYALATFLRTAPLAPQE